MHRAAIEAKEHIALLNDGGRFTGRQIAAQIQGLAWLQRCGFRRKGAVFFRTDEDECVLGKFSVQAWHECFPALNTPVSIGHRRNFQPTNLPKRLG
jgi:hypothetical protein